MTKRMSWGGFIIGCLIPLPFVMFHPFSFGLMILWGFIYGYIVFGKEVKER
jgi:hypothetical protein